MPYSFAPAVCVAVVLDGDADLAPGPTAVLSTGFCCPAYSQRRSGDCHLLQRFQNRLVVDKGVRGPGERPGRAWDEG